MERSAKGFRIVSGLLILINIVAFFLPMVERVKENYPKESWSQLNVVLGNSEPYGSDHVLWMACFIVLPLVLSLLAGIWGIMGSDRQKGSSIIVFIVFALYIALMLTSVGFLQDDSYSLGMAEIINLICSGCSTVVSVIALVVTPEKEVELELTGIPNVAEIKRQQEEERFNGISFEDEASEKPTMVEEPSTILMEKAPPAYVPGNPKGCLVGLTGIYAGAEIPLNNGEFIKIGRTASNDLVFEGQEKVSRNHCRIKWNADEGKFVIYDYSSNGTYVKGSDECLPQNLEIPLEPGTVIEIGDEQNSFRLE